MDFVASRQPKRLPVQISRPRNAGESQHSIKERGYSLLRNGFGHFSRCSNPGFHQHLVGCSKILFREQGCGCVAFLSLYRVQIDVELRPVGKDKRRLFRGIKRYSVVDPVGLRLG
jgi:hypothetical protein